MTNITDDVFEKYEVIVGLEVHAQLSTESKAFCGDSTRFGSSPNRNISPLSLGHPGTLPVINRKMMEYAVKMGLATHCSIRKENHFARKNYFYADLPKGYQITQDLAPICYEGYVNIRLKDGSVKAIRLHRIHMEEDAGKSMHDQHDEDSLIDLNRAGVPLIEIVSEPDIRSGEEAHIFLTEIRKLLRYLDICDGNMEEGSMRCDANISVRLKGENKLGNRCEVKNLNSIRNVYRAIDHEFERQVTILESGGFIDQNTLNFDAVTGKTTVLRSKEMANDYRYFPEPDLPPLVFDDAYVAKVQADLPALPEQLFNKYTTELGLSVYDAEVLTADRDTAIYFESLICHTPHYKTAANWLMGTVKSYLKENDLPWKEFDFLPFRLAALIKLIEDGTVSNSVATHRIFPLLLRAAYKTPLQVAQETNSLIEDNKDDLQVFIDEAIRKFPDKVMAYHHGKKGVTGLFMGEVMRLSKGKIDPKEANKILIQKLESCKK
ncbi:MAG: Asp-tRNA(Asn)/Glu-tRNA(Gln) amidotransferase subunit GatB [Sphingobacteriaceae bacterium]